MDILLGNKTSFDLEYSPEILFPIERSAARKKNGINNILFNGYDVWNSYEFSYLNDKGKPENRILRLIYPSDSQNIIESKSLKLYLNSLNAERFNSAEAVRERIANDLSARAGDQVSVTFGLPETESRSTGELIDALDLDIDDYGPPNPGYLSADPAHVVEELLVSHLLKSNCPVTGQPDWGTLIVDYCGPRLDPASLLAAMQQAM